LEYSNDVITDEEFNIIFGRDLKILNYPKFIKKHGLKCFDIINETNKSLLKNIFIEYAKNDLSLLKMVEYLPELKFFEIGDEIYYMVAANEVARLLNNYCHTKQFIERNGLEFMKWIDDPNTKIVLESKLEIYFIGLDVGYEVIKEKYGKHLEYIFSISFKHSIFVKEFEKCQSNITDYITFKKRNGFPLIRDICTLYPYKESIKAEFSKLSRNELTSEKYKEDRNLFSIGHKEIKDILFQRWSLASIQQIMQEDEGFFSCVGNDFSVEELRPKVLTDTAQMSIVDIAKKYPKLFTSKILTLDAGNLYGLTIATRIAKEIESMASFDDIVNNVPVVLFDCKIIDKNTVGISSLVMLYISSHVNECMASDSKNVHLMEKYELIPNNIIDLYNDTKKLICSIKEKHKTNVNYINYPYQDELRTKMKNIINVFEQKSVHIKQNLEENKNIFGTYQIKINNLQSQMMQLQLQHDKNSVDIKTTSDKISYLQKDNNLIESYDWICQRVRSDQSSLDSATNQLKNDTKCNKLDSEIASLEKQIESAAKLSKLQMEKEELTKSIQILRDRINSDIFRDRKKQLTKDLDNSTVTGLIGVASAINRSYFSSGSRELADMNETEKSLGQKESRLSTIQSKINEIEVTTTISSQDANKLLAKLKSDKKNHIAELKIRLQIDKLEHNISKYKQMKDIKEKMKDHEEKIKKLQQENIQIESEIYRLRITMPIEQHNAVCYDDRCRLLQQELIVAEQELGYNKMAAEKEYNEAMHQMEYERKIQRIALDEKQQKEINEVIDNFKIKIDLV
jgi:hypothetical protein